MLTTAEAASSLPTEENLNPTAISDQLQDFTLVPANKPKTNRRSSLFKYLSKLEPTDNLFVANDISPPKFNKLHNYLLFDVPIKQNSVADLANFHYHLHEQHLRVESIYNEVDTGSARSNLSFAHFSMLLTDQLGQKIKVRIYFNANAKIIHCSAKLYANMEDLHGEAVILTPDLFSNNLCMLQLMV